MLELDQGRPPTEPRDAATLVLVRDGAGGLEVFCVQRHQASAFLGGAVVFPGGKVDASDRDAGWSEHATLPRPASFAPDAETLRALATAACRETLEEAAMLPLVGLVLAHAELLDLRSQAAKGGAKLLALLAERGLRLDLAALYPLARWITPREEARRFDTRFFLAVVGREQQGAHDDRETTASFWATPKEVLARFDDGRLQLAPPTHRTLSLLSDCPDGRAAVSIAESSCLEPICPRLVRQKTDQDDTVALTLPGDPEHDVTEARVTGPSRFVLRGDRWRPESAP